MGARPHLAPEVRAAIRARAKELAAQGPKELAPWQLAALADVFRRNPMPMRRIPAKADDAA
jgi:hypothetical protein